MFLTPDQLHELTGYTRKSAQVRWLRKNGIQHYVRADGRPSVPVDVFTKPDAPQKRQPNFDAVRMR
jgi:Domain of unknown function (DUF4224)